MAKIDFKNMIKIFPRSRGKDKTKIQFKPGRDWAVLLGIFFLLLIFVAAANTYLFIQINTDQIFTQKRTTGEEIEMLDTETLKSTIELFDARSENFDNLLKQKPSIVDPSL